MTGPANLDTSMAEAAEDLRSRQEPFAFATIVRSAGPTAARPGAKALLSADGTIVHGWLGGGCTQAAVRRAALRALEDGTPQLVSVAPEELLAQKGVAAGQEVEGIRFARNGCPSRGTIDIFVEPCLPVPELVVLGSSPVAEALGALAPQFHWSVTATIAAPAAGGASAPKAIVIATQGQGDLAALRAALAARTDHVAFVSSRRKFATLARKLADEGVERAAIEAVKAPAGLDLGAVTPEEIALSILAELVGVRRQTMGEHDG